eukprot:Ihof_evm2s408 gene=Ihof_evmTU2s408
MLRVGLLVQSHLYARLLRPVVMPTLSLLVNKRSQLVVGGGIISTSYGVAFDKTDQSGSRLVHAAAIRNQADERRNTDKQTGVPTCWSCKRVRNTNPARVKDILLCPECKAVQSPLNNLTAFELMGMPNSYDLDMISLRESLRTRQSLVHPDKFAGSSKEDQSNSALLSSAVNKAYTTLNNPLARGLYMLDLQGVRLKEDEKTTDTSLLMEIMDINERLEQAQSEKEVKEIGIANQVNLDEALRATSEAFKVNDLEAAKQALIRLRFYTNVAKSVHYWLPGQPLQ